MVAFSNELFAEICRRMANDGQTLRQICRSEGMPDRSTFYDWVDADPKLADLYARARDRLIEYWSDDTIEISDDSTNDYMKRKASTGGGRSDIDGELEQELVPNHENINRARLRVDTRKWLMAKLMPRKYGDQLKIDQKTELGLSGSAVELLDAISANNRRIHDKSE